MLHKILFPILELIKYIIYSFDVIKLKGVSWDNWVSFIRAVCLRYVSAVGERTHISRGRFAHPSLITLHTTHEHFTTTNKPRIEGAPNLDCIFCKFLLIYSVTSFIHLMFLHCFCTCQFDLKGETFNWFAVCYHGVESLQPYKHFGH